MAEKLDDVLAEVKAAMAAEDNAAQTPAEAPAPEGEQMAEVQPAEAGAETPAAEAEAPTEAPVAAQPASPVPDYNAFFAEQRAVIQQLQEKLAEKDKLVEQQGRRVEETVEKTLEMPRLVLPKYGDEEETARAVDAFNSQMGDYIAAKIAAETAPMKRKYEQAEAEANIAAVKNKMRGDARYADFDNMEKDIDALVMRDPDLAHMNPAKAYTTAYLLARGLAAEKPAPEKSATDIAQEAMSNPEVMRIIAERTAAETQRAQADAPKMPGGGQIPATPAKAPKTLAEARAMAFNLFKK